MKGKSTIMAIPLMILCMALFAVPGRAIVLDGMIDNNEWYNTKVTTVRREILAGDAFTATQAYMRHIVDEAAGTVTFGFQVMASGCTNASRFGAVFLMDGERLVWELNAGSSASNKYRIAGAAWVPAPTAEPFGGEAEPTQEDAAALYTYEIAITSKNSSNYAAFFQALRALKLQLLDPAGVSSVEFSYPVIVDPAAIIPESAEPETTTKRVTTTKVTTTKTTTTKAPTTTKTTAQAVAQKANATQAFASFVWTGTKAAAVTAAHVQTQYAQAAQQKTDVIWYTEPIAAASGAVFQESTQSQGMDDAMLAQQMDPAQASPGEEEPAVPVFLEDEDAQPPASMARPLLFGVAGFLLALALLLLFIWFKGRGYFGKAKAAAAEEEDEEENEDALED